MNCLNFYELETMTDKQLQQVAWYDRVSNPIQMLAVWILSERHHLAQGRPDWAAECRAHGDVYREQLRYERRGYEILAELEAEQLSL